MFLAVHAEPAFLSKRIYQCPSEVGWYDMP
jgi:hypothetical protein